MNKTPSTRKCENCIHSHGEECHYLIDTASKNIKADIKPILCKDARGFGRYCGPFGELYAPK